ncbi:MAG TPA: hypothetical protein VFQ88_09810, partial [Nevskiaceae bacterium]|nr:hypothetical protein [Nevskiaceae bacterium]
MHKRWMMVAALATGLIGGGNAFAAAQTPPDFAHTTVSGDWGGARTTLWDYGVDVRPGFLMEYGHNYTGGTRHTDSVVDNEDFRMTVDFHR